MMPAAIASSKAVTGLRQVAARLPARERAAREAGRGGASGHRQIGVVGHGRSWSGRRRRRGGGRNDEGPRRTRGPRVEKSAQRQQPPGKRPDRLIQAVLLKGYKAGTRSCPATNA